MRKNYFLALVALVGLVFTGCNPFGNTPEYQLSDLQALWLETNVTNKQHYVRFTTEKAQDAGYFLGREWNDNEWDDPDMTYEEFLIWNRDQLGHPGNGWFEYQLETKGDLHEIHFMDNGGADIPKEYIVSVLTDTKLEYYEKDNKNRKFTYEKVVETKK